MTTKKREPKSKPHTDEPTDEQVEKPEPMVNEPVEEVPEGAPAEPEPDLLGSVTQRHPEILPPHSVASTPADV